MRSFFDLPLETKQQYPYEGDTNLGYSMVWVTENVDPTAPKDIKESFNYNDTRMPDHLWPNIDGFKVPVHYDSINIADRLTLRILEKFDTILDTGTTLVDAHSEVPFNTTRVIHYPAYDGAYVKTNKCV